MSARRLYLYVWALFPLLFPFYVFRSGLPQPGDVIMAVLLVVLLPILGVGVKETLRGPIRAAVWFVVYVALVGAVFSAIQREGSFRPAFQSVYYLYNCLVLTACISLYSWFGDRFLRITLISVVISLLLQLGMAVAVGAQTVGRDIGSFNNPNQLGYYAILSVTIILILTRRVPMRASLQAMVVIAGVYLAALSLSKAALSGVALLLILVFVRNPAVTFGLMAMVPLLYFLVDLTPLMERVHTRIFTPQPDDTLATRGYDRLLNYPEYLVFGAGEADWARFESQAGLFEIHSSLGTLLFCYGVVGTSLFVAIIWAIYRCAGCRLVLYLLPIFLYSLTHQGLRFTLFWVALAVTACVGDAMRRSRNVNRSAGPTPPRARGHPAGPRAARSPARSPPG
jgi:hypothetical protein